MTPHANWCPLPRTWETTDDVVHVVQIDVPGAWRRSSGLSIVLSEDERQRALRFRQEADYRRFVVARSALRHLIARLLRNAGSPTEPGEIGIETGEWGKPRLVGGPSIGFNVSHSGDIVLVALAMNREVGVDLEAMRTKLPVENLVSTAFSDEEHAWWASLPRCDQRQAFFDLWTRREALAKAAGTGLGRTHIPWTASAVQETHTVAVAGRTWAVRRFEAAPGYPAAVAVEGTGVDLNMWSYPAPE